MKYEYKEVSQFNSERTREEELNHYGQQGWQFLASDRVAGEMFWLFVREVEEDKQDGADLEKAEQETRGLAWDSIAIEFQQDHEEEGYIVSVMDNDGLIVKTHVHLYEWSGPVTNFINDKDAPGMIAYLTGLNTTTEGERDGTIIRE